MTGGVLTYSVLDDARVGPFTGPGAMGDTGWAWNSTEMDNDAATAGSGWEDQTLTMAEDTIDIGAINYIGRANDGGGVYPIVFLREAIVPESGHTVYMFAGWNTPSLVVAPI